MQRISLVILTMLFVMVIGAQSISAQERKQGIKADGRRGISLNTCVTIENLPENIRKIIDDNQLDQYVDEATTNGMSPKTALELGWTTRGVWNERPGRGTEGQPGYRPTMFCFSILDVDAVIDTMNGDANPQFGYLHGCKHATIKNFKNRVIPPPPVIIAEKGDQVEVPCKQDEQGMTLRKREELPNGDIKETWFDDCNYEYRTIKKAVEIKQFVAACPVGITADGGLDFWRDRVLGAVINGKIQKGISAGGSIFVDKVIRGRDGWGGTLKDAGWSVLGQAVQEGYNAQETWVKISLPGVKDPFKVRRGDNKQLVPGISTKWVGKTVFIVAKPTGQGYSGQDEFICGSGALKETSNLALVTNGDGRVVEAIKTLPTNGPQTPERPRVFFSWVPQVTPLAWKDFTSNPRYGYSDILTGQEPTFNQNGLAYKAATAQQQVAPAAAKKPKFKVASNMTINN